MDKRPIWTYISRNYVQRWHIFWWICCLVTGFTGVAVVGLHCNLHQLGHWTNYRRFRCITHSTQHNSAEENTSFSQQIFNVIVTMFLTWLASEIGLISTKLFPSEKYLLIYFEYLVDIDIYLQQKKIFSVSRKLLPTLFQKLPVPQKYLISKCVSIINDFRFAVSSVSY